MDLKCLNYVETDGICRPNVNKCRKQKEKIFSVLTELINLVSFAELVNSTNLAQSSHIQAIPPHQPLPSKPC